MAAENKTKTSKWLASWDSELYESQFRLGMSFAGSNAFLLIHYCEYSWWRWEDFYWELKPCSKHSLAFILIDLIALIYNLKNNSVLLLFFLITVQMLLIFFDEVDWALYMGWKQRKINWIYFANIFNISPFVLSFVLTSFIKFSIKFNIGNGFNTTVYFDDILLQQRDEFRILFGSAM